MKRVLILKGPSAEIDVLFKKTYQSISITDVFKKVDCTKNISIDDWFNSIIVFGWQKEVIYSKPSQRHGMRFLDCLNEIATNATLKDDYHTTYFTINKDRRFEPGVGWYDALEITLFFIKT